ncbi:MAG: TonB-dependent receptor [Tannerella sp.]|jgi:TonB-linked SusC/RagA family outer membrane protein|nr:TonB-dependent receptor [Tannerella sp.]
MKKHSNLYFNRNNKSTILFHLFKTTLIILFTLCFGVTYANSNYQETTRKKTVTGVVSEADGETLPGVNVTVKGTSSGTITNADGEYTISAENSSVLVFSYMGKKPVEITVGNRNIISVVMEDDTHVLEEVVVYTGYMTQKKADLTGSLAIANGGDIEKNPSANAMKSLQGKLSGVHITTNGGNPAESVGIQVRGLTSLAGAIQPLIVLDGMPTQNLNLRDINSNDIESIQVLKDAASASIYGARASGGVVLIQTKKGKDGKTTVEYSGSVSFNTVLNKPELMNAEQYGVAAFRAQAYDEEVYGIAMSLPATYNFTWHRDNNGRAVLDDVSVAQWLNADQTVRGSDTNWMEEVLRTAVMTNHQLTVSSGTDKSRSLFSLGFYDNEGTQIHTFFRQYSIRSNTEYSLINNRLKIGENMALSYLQYKDANETRWAMINPPAAPVYDINGGWAGAAGFDDFTNPVRVLTMNKDNVNNYVKIIGNIFLDLNIWKGISARTQFGVDYGNSYNRAVEGVWSENGGRNSDGENYVGSYQHHPLNYVWTNTLSYHLDVNKHSLDAVLGTEFTRFVEEGFSARREGIYLEDRDFAHIGATTGSKYALTSSADEYTYFSLFGKANYVYDAKYLLSFTLRRDGSSLFGKNNRYGTFPAFSAGWRLKNESFMESLDFLSDLKLRGGWGANGSVQGLPRGYTSTPFSTDYFSTSYPIEGNETGALYSGYYRTWLGNPDLKWETTTQTDLAVDYGFLNQRIRGSLGYYFKKTKDILVQTPYIAAMGEGGEPWINGASMNNRGFEFEVVFGSNPADAFQYAVSANIGTYKTKLVNLPQNVINKYPGDGVLDLVLGRTPNIHYGHVADGLFNTQDEVDNHAEQPGKAVGRIRYKDLDGNGYIDGYDRTYIGIADPDFYGGITFDLGYRNFDMNVFFQGVYGNKVNNVWKQESDLWNISVPAGKNHPTRILDAWSFDNPNSEIPAISNSTQNAENRFSSYYVEDGSYLKLRNVEIGYTLPGKISDRMFMQHVRIYASARNVLTLKKGWGKDQYTGFDPEMPDYGYLTPFSVTFGLNVKF